MGIAVFTATDVAKSAAGIVLTEPGFGGIVAAVQEGRTTFQRILTYTFRSIVHKVAQSQVHGSKVGAHRYERRKVRECLRQAKAEPDSGLAAIENALLQR